jgi:hypothetical protein
MQCSRLELVAQLPGGGKGWKGEDELDRHSLVGHARS